MMKATIRLALQSAPITVPLTLDPVEPEVTWWWQRRLLLGITVADLIQAVDAIVPGDIPEPMGGEPRNAWAIRVLDALEPHAEVLSDSLLSGLCELAVKRLGWLGRLPGAARLARRVLDPLVPELAFTMARRALGHA